MFLMILYLIFGNRRVMTSDKHLEKFKEIKKSLEKNDYFFMPEGFPINGFLKAWFEPLSGYDLTWIELEILYRTFNYVSIKHLMDLIVKDFPQEEKDFSTFYRKVKQMITRKLLEDKKEGRETLVKIAEPGAIELGKFARYNMLKSYAIVQSAWKARFANIIREHESCIHKKSTIGVFNSVEVLEDILSVCEEKDLSNKVPIYHKEKFFLFFTDKGQDIDLKSNLIQLIKVASTSLVLKDEIAELFISSNLFANVPFNKISDFLMELKRVLKKGSSLYFSELKKDLSNPMIENWGLFAQIMQYSLRSQTWDLKEPVAVEEIVPLLSKHFSDVKVETFGFTNLISAKNT